MLGVAVGDGADRGQRQHERRHLQAGGEPPAPPVAPAPLDAVAAHELLDDRGRQAEAVLRAVVREVVRAPQPQDLGIVRGSQSLDQREVAPRQRDERVRAPRAARKPSSWTSSAPLASRMPGISPRTPQTRRAAARLGCQAYSPHVHPGTGGTWAGVTVQTATSSAPPSGHGVRACTPTSRSAPGEPPTSHVRRP